MTKRVIDLANPGGWITKRVAFTFKNSLVWGDSVNREYATEFKKVGDKVIVRKPVQFDSIDGFDTGGDITGAVQPLDERNTVITVNANPIVPFEYDDKDMALSLEDFDERYNQPAAYKLANMADLAIARQASKFSNVVGAPGTTPADFDAVAAAGECLDLMSVPRDGMRSFLINPKANRKLSGNLAAAFNPQSMSSDAFKMGMIGQSAGFDVKMSQIILSHTDGTQDKTGLVDGGSQVGPSIDLKGFTAGDQILTNAIVTFAGVYSVNRFTKVSTGNLMQFNVRADATADGGGDMTISISPDLIVTGPYQNVTGSPADGASVVVATYGALTPPTPGIINAAFHKNAIGLATIPLVKPNGFDISEVFTYNGWSVRFVRGFNILTGKWVSRVETMFATDCLEPTAGVRVLG